MAMNKYFKILYCRRKEREKYYKKKRCECFFVIFKVVTYGVRKKYCENFNNSIFNFLKKKERKKYLDF